MGATATAQAPREAEIREAIRHEIATGRSSGTTGDNLASELRSVIRDMANPLSNPAFLALEPDVNAAESDEGDLWYDLRISEASRLRDLYRQAIDRAAERCEAIIVEELTAAGVVFAAEHPDAPRP